MLQSPIARSIEDCALVLDAIHGHDGLDPTAVDQPFDWPPNVNLDALKIGCVEESQRPSDQRKELKVLRELGFELVPIALAKDYPLDAITLMLGTQATGAKGAVGGIWFADVYYRYRVSEVSKLSRDIWPTLY
ncbi:MAG: amidase family protein [Isosphaeraceae bacterium]